MRNRVLTTVVTISMIAGTGVAAQQSDQLDAAINSLRRSLLANRSGTEVQVVESLGSLNDDSMRSLLVRLAQEGPRLARVAAITALATMEDPPRIDPELIRGLDGEIIRLAAINRAAARDLVDTAMLQTMLTWSELEDAPRLAVIGELMRHGEPVDAGLLEEIASRAQDRVEWYARSLLAHIRGTGDMAGVMAEVEALDRTQRDVAVAGILNDIMRYRMTALVPFVERFLHEDERWPVREAALAALIELDPDRGIDRWSEGVGRSSRHVDIARHALLLFDLAAEKPIPGASFAKVRNGDPLLEAIADAGEALADDSDAVMALKALLDLDHPRSSLAAITAAERLPTNEAIEVYRHGVERLDGSRPANREIGQMRSLVAIHSAKELSDLDPALVRSMLTEARDDSITQQMILIGATDGRPDGIAGAARSLRRLGTGYADALTVLLIAASVDDLSTDERRSLATIAAGGANLADPQQAVAAWLFIKHSNAIDQAISALFNK